MRNEHSGKNFESRPPSGSEIDYSPRTYTLRDKIVFSLKLLGIVGILVLLLWLFD